MKRNFILGVSLATNFVLITLWAIGAFSGNEESRQATVEHTSSILHDQPMPLIADEPTATPSSSGQPIPRAAEGEEALDPRSLISELYELDLRVIPKRFLSEIDVTAIDWDGRISGAAKELFFLSDEEVERLNRSLAAGLEMLRQLEREHVEVTRVSEDEFRFHIPPLGELASDVRVALQRDVFEVLGQNDGETFWNWMISGSGQGAGRIFREFSQWGEDLHFRVTARYPSEVWVSLTRQTYSSADGLRNNITRPLKLDLDNPRPMPHLFDRQSHLAEYLPNDLRPFFETPK